MHRGYIIFAVLFAFLFEGLLSSHTGAAVGADGAKLMGSDPAAKSQLDPPIGNYVIRRVEGKGNQLYRCTIPKGSAGEEPAAAAWISTGAKANLFPLIADSSPPSESIGLHYFLPHPDARGGKATWSSTAPGSNDSTVPDSTVTGKVLVSIPSPAKGNVNSLLLVATGHTGSGSLHAVSYIQRILNKGGVPPSTSKCTKDGLIARVPYQSHYIFWAQLSSLPSQQLMTTSYLNPPPKIRPLLSFFGEGYQYYTYNGSSWSFMNVSASLSSGPGQEIVGRHYLWPKADQKGGILTWETFYPQSSVTAVMVEEESVDPMSITWVLLQTTSSSGEGGLLDSVLWIERVSTRDGLPPPSSTPAHEGDTYMSPFSCIYWFYVNSNNQ